VQRQRLPAPPRILNDGRARDVHDLFDDVELAQAILACAVIRQPIE
jgi:hypothetical protein